MRTTGLLQVDVEYDFLRARRRQFLATLGHRLRVRCRDGNRLVPLDEVVGPAGWRGERRLGRQTIRLDTIVGTAERRRDFDVGDEIERGRQRLAERRVVVDDEHAHRCFLSVREVHGGRGGPPSRQCLRRLVDRT